MTASSDLLAWQRVESVAAELCEQGMHPLQARIVAGDILSQEGADQAIADGLAPEKAVWLVGSYARMGWALRALPRPLLLRMLPELWCGSDPDDSDPAFLQLWRAAFQANGGEIITDSQPLPAAGQLLVYRGQLGDKLGISWTLDRKIARKFAMNGGQRVVTEGGVILERSVPRRHILAYLTGRGEQEIIVDIAPEASHASD